MNEFKSYLKNSQKYIQREILSAVTSLKSLNPELADEQKILLGSIYGGKNIRGTLVHIGYALTSPVEKSDIWKIAAAFEILHASLLIHDDIIDRSTIRRGKPTAHVSLGNNHYGTSQAICLGDIGFFLANRLIAESKFPVQIKTNILAFFSQMVMDTIVGEMLDVKISLPGVQKKESEIILMQRLKTASYTVVGPLSVGAMVAGKNVKRLGNIKQFGEHLGMAFQVQDDILGIFGDERIVGKSATSDIEENKSTLLIVQALKNANPSQHKILEQYYGKGTIGSAAHIQIKKVFEDTGALAYSQSKVVENIMEGKKFIPRITKNSKYQKLLTQFADFIVSRQK